MNTIHKIVNGDSRQMSLLKDKSVHLIITSPPYWQLKDYGSDHQRDCCDNGVNMAKPYLYTLNNYKKRLSNQYDEIVYIFTKDIDI
jgi:DNA modification methylase